MKFKKTLLLAVALFVLGTFVAACSSQGTSATSREQNAQSQDLSQQLTNQPPGDYPWSQLRQNLKEIQDAQANPTQTTTFFFNYGVADPQGSCPSIGFPISATDQLTNPQKITWVYTSGGSRVEGVIGNPDPTGIYSGSSSSGTYVMCVSNTGKLYVHYWEGPVDVETGAVAWDYAHHHYTDLTNPTGNFTVGQK